MATGAPTSWPSAKETVEIERRLGFTHSHNDEKDVLDRVGVEGQTRE